MVEVWDLTQGTSSNLAIIRTRAFVTGSDIARIAGVILGGSSGNYDPVILRGIGPSLAQFGLSPLLANPTWNSAIATATLSASMTTGRMIRVRRRLSLRLAWRYLILSSPA